MKIYEDLIQGTDEWFKCRKMKMTASHAQAIGNNGKGLETYITEMMAEHFSKAEKENFSNEHTERGNELEEYARFAYSLKEEVKEVGFIEMNEYVGCSPDGLVGEDGLLEIKCLNDVNHYKKIIDRKIDSKYDWQIQMQLLVTERKWCDLLYFNPNYDEDMIVFRIKPDKEKQEKLKVGIESGIKIIKEQLKKYGK